MRIHLVEATASPKALAYETAWPGRCRKANVGGAEGVWRQKVAGEEDGRVPLPGEDTVFYLNAIESLWMDLRGWPDLLWFRWLVGHASDVGAEAGGVQEKPQWRQGWPLDYRHNDLLGLYLIYPVLLPLCPTPYSFPPHSERLYWTHLQMC